MILTNPCFFRYDNCVFIPCDIDHENVLDKYLTPCFLIQLPDGHREAKDAVNQIFLIMSPIFRLHKEKFQVEIHQKTGKVSSYCVRDVQRSYICKN